MNYITIVFWLQVKYKPKKLLLIYELKTDNYYNIPIGTVTKLKPYFFDKEKYIFVMRTYMFKTEAKKIHVMLQLNKSLCLKSYIKFIINKNNKSRKKWKQRWKRIFKFIEQCCIW